MCLKIPRTSFLVLVLAIYLELSVRNGIHGDSQVHNYNKANTKENLTLPQAHHQAHGQNWKGWEDWLPTSAKNHDHAQRSQQPPPHIPLSPSGQTKQSQHQRKRTEKHHQGFNNSNTRSAAEPQIRAEKTVTKTKMVPVEEDFSTMVDMSSVKDVVMKFASSVLTRFMSQWTLSSSPWSAVFDQKFNSDYDFLPSRNGRAVYLDNLDRPDGPNAGKPEREAQRGVTDWLARLIGVQGKTLGEFLREYQVHVLYDLAFTFFKWIFFLYAGLLIP